MQQDHEYPRAHRSLRNFHRWSWCHNLLQCRAFDCYRKRFSVQQNKTIITVNTGCSKTRIWCIAWPSRRPWASPLHMVKKSNGTWKRCRDYWRVNVLTSRPSLPVSWSQTLLKARPNKGVLLHPEECCWHWKDWYMHSIWQFRVPLDAVPLAWQLLNFPALLWHLAQTRWLCIIMRAVFLRSLKFKFM